MEFVGRVVELRALSNAIGRGPGSALVSGPVGIGKTALLDRLARDCEAGGWFVERVSGTSSGAVIPFGAFLHVRGPDPPPLLGVAEQLVRLAAALRIRAGDRRLLLLVDDAHMFDPVSLMLVQQLVTRREAAVVLTACGTEPRLQDLANLVKDGHTVEIDLAPLRRAECEQLVEQRLAGPVEPAVQDEVWRLSEGNPLFVGELVDSGTAAGALTQRDGRWKLGTRLSPSPLLRDLVGRRVQSLAADERELLEALSVAGPLPLTVVEGLLDLDRILDLEAAGLVRSERAPTGDSVRLAHSLWGELACEMASAADPQLVRGRVLAAVAEWGAGGADDLLLQARLSLDAGEIDVALYLEASNAAFQRLDGEFALRCAAAAVEAGEAGGDVAAERAYANALGLAGPLDEAAEAFTALPARFSDPAGDGTVLTNLANQLLFEERQPDQAVRGRPERALEMAEAALHDLRDVETDPAVGSVGLADLIWSRLLALWQLGRAVDGDEPWAPFLGDDAAPAVERDGLCAAMTARQSFLRGHLDAAVAGWRESDESLGEVVTPRTGLDAAMSATAQAWRGEPAEAWKLVAIVDGTPVASRAGPRWWTERARAMTAAAEGDIDAAVQRSVELADEFAVECFCATTSLHDVVRLGRSDLVAEKLRAQSRRDGATWWDRVCADHAEAAGGGALLDVSHHFETSGIDHYACEAAAQATRGFLEAGDRVSAAGASVRVAALLSPCGRLRTPALDGVVPLLTDREHEVARLAAAGLSNPEIAARLGTSVRTIGNQLQAVYRKLGVHTRSELSSILDGSTVG